MRFNNGKGLKSINLLSNMIARSDDFNFLADSGYDTYTETLALIAKQKQLYNDGTFENFDYIVSGLELEVITGQLILKAGAAVSFKGYYHGTLAFGYVASPGDVFSVVVPESAILTIDDNIGGAYDRFDVIEIRPIKQTYDTKSRQFRDPITGVVTSALVNIKNEFGYEIQIKKGNAAVQNFAQATTAGWIKLAEYKMPVGASTVSKVNIISVKDSYLWLTDKDSVKYLENKNPMDLNNGLVGTWLGNVPEYPDNPSGVTYFQNTWNTVDGWGASSGNGSVSVAGNSLFFTKTGPNVMAIASLDAVVGSSIRLKIRVASGTVDTPVLRLRNSGSNYGAFPINTDGSWNIIDTTVTINDTMLSAFYAGTLASSNTYVLEIKFYYIGNGTYSSRALDISGKGNHAQIFGATPVEGGFSGDGVSDYLSLGNALNLPGPLTWACWFKCNTTASIQTLISKDAAGSNRGPWLFVNATTGRPAFTVSGDGASQVSAIEPSINYADNNWHFAVGVFTPGVSVALFVDGALRASTPTAITSQFASSASLLLLARPTTTISLFNGGAIRYPRIYNRALTAAEIKELYLNPTGNIVDDSVKANTAIPNSNAVRGSGGQLKAADPIESNDLVTKSYYDTNLNPIVAGVNKLINSSKSDTFKRIKSYLINNIMNRWQINNSVSYNGWNSICYSSELRRFVAVGSHASGYNALISNDSVNWTPILISPITSKTSVCWSPELELFVAVADSGTGNRVCTSPDGINWTSQTSAADNSWSSVCWSPELGLFCAVATSGTGNRVMTSPNGINWTIRTSAADNNWTSVCWSPELGIFVAIANTGTDRVMTSPNGIDWTVGNIQSQLWQSICWSPELGLFCAVGTYDTDKNNCATSPDGINWTLRLLPNIFDCRSICWSPELGVFCAISDSGPLSAKRILISKDGIRWTYASLSGTAWRSICWGKDLGVFAAVSYSMGTIGYTYDYTMYN